MRINEHLPGQVQGIRIRLHFVASVGQHVHLDVRIAGAREVLGGEAFGVDHLNDELLAGRVVREAHVEAAVGGLPLGAPGVLHLRPVDLRVELPESDRLRALRRRRVHSEWDQRRLRLLPEQLRKGSRQTAFAQMLWCESRHSLK